MGYHSSALHVYSMVYIMPRLSLPSRLVPLIPSYYMGWWSVGESQLLSPLDHWQTGPLLFLLTVLASLAGLGLLVSRPTSHPYFLLLAQNLAMAVFIESQRDRLMER